jgi:lysophospholipase L1-like esterase
LIFVHELGHFMTAKLVDTIKAYEGHPVRLVISTIPPNRRSSVNARVTKYNAKIREIAASRGLTIVDPGLTVGDLADGTHPNPEGYRKIALAWSRVL